MTLFVTVYTLLLFCEWKQWKQACERAREGDGSENVQ